MSAAQQVLRVSVEGDVVIAELSRPEARNALNRALIHELRELIDALDRDPPGACIITGAGSAFCAGGDLKERRAMDPHAVRRVRAEIVDLFTHLGRSPIPLVAALNGAARGGGFELALASDFIVAAQGVEMGLPEVDLGIIPGGGGTQNLVRIAGVPLAREMILLGRLLSADEAHTAGLVHQVVSANELITAAMRLAELLAAKPRVAMRQARTAIADAWGFDIGTALRRENELYDACINDPARLDALDQFASSNRSDNP